MFSVKPLAGGSTPFDGDTPGPADSVDDAAANERPSNTESRAEHERRPHAPSLLRKKPAANIAEFPSSGRRGQSGNSMRSLSLMEQRRGAVRLSTAIEAYIVARDREIHRCIIRDLSTNGAQLECEEAMKLGGEMVLAVPKANIAITCEIAWRRGIRMGVQFCRGRMTGEQIEDLLKL